MTDQQKLHLILKLCSICLNTDVSELKVFISVNSRYVETGDFNKILRKAIKILEFKRCGTISCSDWLMNELFQLYKIDVIN